jgi:hypothetical protein
VCNCLTNIKCSLFSRYFFKTKTDEEERDCEVVYEEVRDDELELPLYEGKIVGKVEKVDS